MTGFLLAEFATARETVDALRKAAQAGKAAEDLLSPNPLEGAAEYLAPPPAKAPIGWVMFVAGTLGAIGGYGMQWYSAVVDYPIHSGGRPLDSWPAFLLVPYETAILSAAVVGILAWLWMCGLPKPFHPLFAADAVERATQDRYLLVFPRAATPKDWIETTLKPLAIHDIRHELRHEIRK